MIQSPSIPIPLDFTAVYGAWQKARQGKKPSYSQMQFEHGWMDEIENLSMNLTQGRWQPRRATCFSVTRPKAREIHAPHFADRVVHHALIPSLEAIFEPRFIEDSFANRKGKGIHQAVARAGDFSRAVFDGAGKGGGYYLQLDIVNFFYSIHRPTLYAMLKTVLQAKREKASSPERKHQYLALQSFCHKLLCQATDSHFVPTYRASDLPLHKQLIHAPAHCGLPIGNLSSQFFANVYLNALDQFVKHTLKIRYFVRFVDDFVLWAKDRESLLIWQKSINLFLAQSLGLATKTAEPQPISQGIDFLGYRVYPHHRTVRPRVVRHWREKIEQWQQGKVKACRCENGAQYWHIGATPNEWENLRATMNSYMAHINHAHAYRLRQRILVRYPWLSVLFGRTAWMDGKIAPQWAMGSACGVTDFMEAIHQQYQEAWVVAQVGNRFWVLLPRKKGGYRLLKKVYPALWQIKKQKMQDQGEAYIEIAEVAWLKNGKRRRMVVEWFINF